MTRKVIYFTRTGNSKRIAEKIAKHLNVELIELTDDADWTGAFGALRAGFAGNKEVKITLSGPMDADEYIAVTPLWAGKIVPGFRELFKTLPKEKVHLVVSSGASHVNDREGFKSITEITERENKEDELIASLVQKLSG